MQARESRVVERSYEDICELQQCAKIIREQIGIANLMAVGAREFKFMDTYNWEQELARGLTFKVNAGVKRQWMEVELKGDDTYTVALWKTTKKGNILLEIESDVYCEQLGSIVYHMVNK